jgi:hypothetical protein
MYTHVHARTPIRAMHNRAHQCTTVHTNAHPYRYVDELHKVKSIASSDSKLRQINVALMLHTAYTEEKQFVEGT